jgi:2-polyprenyl-3-methyl-5-hydroxy-6-metoxy-1,4-benzoquinol methylase
MKYEKESYITEKTNVEAWEHHANVKILNDFRNYITGSVLDIGCNVGTTTYWLKDHNVSHITGVDINTNSLEYAKRFFNEIQIPSHFMDLDLTKTKLDKTFDTIISFHTLEHIYEEDVNVFVSNIYDMLGADRYFIISIPYERAYADHRHVSYYNEESLNNLMIKAGFTPIKCFRDERWNEKNLLTALYKK